MRPTLVLLGLSIVVAGCRSDAAASSSPVPEASASQAAASATPRPEPPGLIAFDRHDTVLGAEGPYLGTVIIRPDGTGERPLPMPDGVVETTPAWSPDGRELLVWLWIGPSGPGRPGIISSDGTGLRTIDGAEDLGCGDWSPSGTMLVCSRSGPDPDRDGIYLIGTDGNDLEQLTASPFHHTIGTAGECGGGDARPVFSPDGAWIAFIRQKCGAGANPAATESSSIYVMQSDGSGLEMIVDHGLVKSHPGTRIDWSLDGEWIVFGSQDGRLFRVRPDGKDRTEIPLPHELGRYHAYGPGWSPDGSRVVFSMYRDSEDSTDLYIVSPDGSDLVRLTDTDGAENFANWGLPLGS